MAEPGQPRAVIPLGRLLVHLAVCLLVAGLARELALALASPAMRAEAGGRFSWTWLLVGGVAVATSRFLDRVWPLARPRR